MKNSVKLESSCTPGPWVVQGTMQGLTIYGTLYGFGNTVADVAGATEDRSWERAKANANLIAAAPDLLAACEGALAALEHMTNYTGDESEVANGEILALRAAKAEGVR